MKASILINNYNNEKYLRECIDSALQQNYKDVEVIVCDDCSTDGSVDVLLSYGDRIKVVSNSEHTSIPSINQYHAILNAFNASTGEIIFLLDSDDYFHLEKVARIVPHFRNEYLVFAQHLLEEIDENSNLTNNIRPLLIDTLDYKAYIESSGSILSLFTPTSGQIYRRSFIEKVILTINEKQDLSVWTDLRLPYHAIFNGEILSLNEVWTYYRKHSENDSSKLTIVKQYNEFLRQCSSYFSRVANYYHSKIILLDLPEIFRYSPFIENLTNKKKLDNINKDKSIYIWGAGEAGRGMYQWLLANGYRVYGFIEGNSAKHGEVVDDLLVFSSDILSSQKTVTIIITPYYSVDTIINTIGEKYPEFSGELIDPYKR